MSMKLRWSYIWLYDFEKGRECCISFFEEFWRGKNMYPSKIVLSLKVKLYKHYCKEKIP